MNRSHTMAVATALLASVSLACGGGSGGGGADSATNRAAVAIGRDSVFRGNYYRMGLGVHFTPCGTRMDFIVQAPRPIIDRLDSSLAQYGFSKQDSMIFAQFRGKAHPGRSSNPGNLDVTAVDSTRERIPDECHVGRPDIPPPYVRAKLEAAMRAALGPDANQVRPGNYVAGSVWLNGDDFPDAAALVKGGKLCSVNGCTLLIFEGKADSGYTLAGKVISVEPPVLALTRSSGGWHDLGVGVYQGNFGHRLAWLVRRAGHYPYNAAVEADVRTGNEGFPIIKEP